MKAREHSFTRDGITYDCLACVIKSGAVVPVGMRKQWFVTTNGRENPAMPYTGHEFATRDDRRAFEDAIVDLMRGSGPP